ncbi:MAG: S49 family peptidase, partial [Deltaproteobacteria bacterium]|nr:S49 family peptidase [Deltaproteobacteria bacterium]
MRPALAFLLLSVLPSVAAAQTSALREQYQTDGVALPPTGVALVDEVTAAEINPAGVALLGKPQLFYLHERSLRADRVIDAAFVGTGLFGWGGLSLGMQWVRPRGLSDYRKTTWTLGIGNEIVALGASYNDFSSDQAGLDRLASWDAGLTVRPWRYLSLGAAARDFDGPTVDGVQLPRRYDLGFALRPFTDRIALSGDFLIDDQRGLPGSSLSFAAQAEPVPGLVVSGGLAVGLHTDEVIGQVALTLNTPYVGATWSGGAGSDVSDNWSQLVQLRLSAERYRPLPLARDQVLVLDIPQRLSPPSGGLLSLLTPSKREPYLELLAAIERIRKDPGVAGVLIKVSELPDVGPARVEELRQALVSLRSSGKRLWALFMDGGDNEYLLATAAERIWAVPQATFQVNGYSTTATFLAATLAGLGVKVDVARVGEYKTAPDSFTRTSMSPEEREMLDAWLDGLYRRSLATIEKARSLGTDPLRATLDRGILTAGGAKEAGLIDEIVYPDELQKMLENGHGRSLDLVGEETKEVAWPRRWGARPRIAIVNVEGLIAEGKSRSDPFGLTRVAGAESALRELQMAVDDPLTKAIVVRVDSTGGSGAASDLVWRAIRKVREFKPVVVSMGDYAASGGYYIAMAGERVFAEPSTLTGSIGVFALKPDLSGL